MNKAELQKACEEKGINFSDGLSKAELEKLLSEPNPNIIELKIKHKHPSGKYRIGRHIVGRGWKKFEMNEKELAILDSVEGKYWISKK